MSALVAAAAVRARARSLASIVGVTAALFCHLTSAAAATPLLSNASPVLAAAVTDVWQPAGISAVAAGVDSARGSASMFQATDNTGATMDGLDIIANPVVAAPSYLGTYHMSIGHGRFALRLAASKDLRSWKKIADLDAIGGGMGALRALPGGGFLLAYEAQAPTDLNGDIDSNVRLRYYRDPAALLAGAATEERTLPHLLSSTNEGTPDFRSIAWHGSLASSTIRLGFHYLDHGSREHHRRLPVDREALGTLAANRWSAAADTSVDRALTRLGFDGNHGARRQFTSPTGGMWRIYEAQRRVNKMSSWRLLLFDVGARTWRLLSPATPGGSKAFANPTVSIVPSPRGTATTALVMTTFVHIGGAGPHESGEAVSYVEL